MDVTNVKVEFYIIADDLNLDQITYSLGIAPNHTHHKSEILKSGRVLGYDVWGIETDYEESLDITDQFNKIIDPLRDKAGKINEILSLYKAECKFCIVVNVENGEFPAMYFDRELIKFMASINAEIEFDPYFYSDCE